MDEEIYGEEENWEEQVSCICTEILKSKKGEENVNKE